MAATTPRPRDPDLTPPDLTPPGVTSPGVTSPGVIPPGTPAAPDGLPAAAPLWCDRCGGGIADGDHQECANARAWEPPRFCGHCRRRMKVQVVPTGWTATCVAHGIRDST